MGENNGSDLANQTHLPQNRIKQDFQELDESVQRPECEPMSFHNVTSRQCFPRFVAEVHQEQANNEACETVAQDHCGDPEKDI